MSIDGIAALIFVLLLGLFLWRKRSQVELQRALFPLLYVVMYRSKLGLVSMERLAKKFPRTLRLFADLSVILGFIGMVLICAELLFSSVKLFTGPAGMPGIQPVLPIEAKGVFFVPFSYWIISIFLLAVVHEFAHGVIARLYNIPVKSSGFAFLCLLLPIVPAAFVEPEEKVVNKRSFRQQWGVFAAGPVSNLFFALVTLGIFMLVSPLLSGAFDIKGVELVQVTDGGSAFVSGLRSGDVITALNNVSLSSPFNLSSLLNSSSPGDVVFVDTLNSSFAVTLGGNPSDSSKAFLGVQVAPYLVPNVEFVESYGSWLPSVLKWFAGLFFWLFMLNIGIGLFNLLPIGPLDGGRMFQLVCLKLFKKERALKVWASTSLFFVLLILGNLLIGFIR